MKSKINSLLITISIGSATSVLAAPPETTTYFGGVWSGIGFVLGYGNEAAYVKYACNGTDPGTSAECDGPPREGLVRKFTSIVDGMLNAAAFSTCTDIPTSGTKDVSYTPTGSTTALTATLTFKTPTQKIPASWTGGGTMFDRRMEFGFSFGGSAIKAIVEGSCTHAQTGFMSMNMLVGSHAAGYERPINVWTGMKNGNSIADVYTIERTSTTGTTRSNYAYNVEINETTKNYKMVGAMSNYFGSGGNYAGVDVFNVNGNFNSHQLSMRNKRFVVTSGTSNNGNALDTSNAIASMTGADESLIEAATGFAVLTPTSTSAAGPIAAAQGCMDFDADATAPTSNVACTGLDFLTEAATPVIDSTGKFSALWLLNTAKGKLVEVPAL